MTDLPDTAGLRLVSSALAFWRAAECLHRHDPKGLAWAPCFVNLGLAIELGLKGFCRENGMSEEEQLSLRHDLVRALDDAERRGFILSRPFYRNLIEEIGPSYKDMSLRYQIRRKRSATTVADGYRSNTRASA